MEYFNYLSAAADIVLIKTQQGIVILVAASFLNDLIIDGTDPAVIIANSVADICFNI